MDGFRAEPFCTQLQAIGHNAHTTQGHGGPDEHRIEQKPGQRIEHASGDITGLGASLSDIAYALLTGYGMSFVFDYVNKNIFYLQLFGSIMLLAFGIYTFRSNPVQSIRPVSTNKGSYFHNFITAFAVTLSNPLIIFLFIGLFARFAFVSEGVLVFEAVTGYLAIALGALAWWFGITYFVNKVRTQFNLRGIWILNRIIGGIVIVVSVFGLVFTLMGESLY